jgi:hypothetical protein
MCLKILTQSACKHLVQALRLGSSGPVVQCLMIVISNITEKSKIYFYPDEVVY